MVEIPLWDDGWQVRGTRCRHSCGLYSSAGSPYCLVHQTSIISYKSKMAAYIPISVLLILLDRPVNVGESPHLIQHVKGL